MCRLTSITFLLLICLLTSYKKSLSTGKVEFSFSYNGRTYNNIADGAPIVSNGDIIGIEIWKPDVFGGVLHFDWNNNCAYIVPSGTDIFYDNNTCQYNSAGPIDSSGYILTSRVADRTTRSATASKRMIHSLEQFMKPALFRVASHWYSSTTLEIQKA
jgi:hypothetical protein